MIRQDKHKIWRIALGVPPDRLKESACLNALELRKIPIQDDFPPPDLENPRCGTIKGLHIRPAAARTGREGSSRLVRPC